jgi:hypothetical protein
MPGDVLNSLHMHHYTRKCDKIVLFCMLYHVLFDAMMHSIANAKQFPAIISFDREMPFCSSLILMRESKKPALIVI